MISSFKEQTGDTGYLEVYYLEYTKEQQESLRKLAKKNMTWYQAWLLTDTVKNNLFLLMGDILFTRKCWYDWETENRR